MSLEKKDVIIIILSFCLFISSLGNILLGIDVDIPYHPPWEPETLIIGTGTRLYDLDPTDCWDRASQNVIEQVVETLFTYDTRQFIVDETVPRINWLATGYSWDITNTILTVDIRTGVSFHDGTQMDATAVAWSFNRFMYVMNHTGEIPSDGRAVKVHSLYEFPDGSPVLQSVVALDFDTVVFTLTAPYAPILDAMCYISAGILSPASTPPTSIIDLATGDIVGTGPYTYDYYIWDTEVRFTKFNNYWATQAPFNLEDEIMFDLMIYRVIDDPTTLNYAMLNKDIDILFEPSTDLLPVYRMYPLIKVYEPTTPGLVYQYLAFNTRQINVTWRKAMSYALNYSYVIEEILDGCAFRAYGAISRGSGVAFNPDLAHSDPAVGAAVYNLTIARQTLIDDPGVNTTGLTASDDPDDVAWESANLAFFNYSYNTDNWFRNELSTVLIDWYADIGIVLENGGTDWEYFILRAYGYVLGGYDQLQVYFIYWTPDYLDPFNMLNVLFSNTSFFNACQINDHQIMQWLSDALQETNQTARYQIYYDIQWRLFAELYVHAAIYHPKLLIVHSADLYDVGYNGLGRWWALPVKRNLTWVPTF